ncbi:MAG: cobaltochelatase subunit CobT, partial [Gluconobacter sp.]
MSAPKNSPPDENRQEGFRRATIATLRAMGGTPEQSVDFQGAVVGNRLPAPPAPDAVQLPYLSRSMHDREIQKIRGAADAAALKLRYHKSGLNAQFPEPQAQEAFNVLEQARCEVYGSRHMAGVRANLDQRVIQQCAEAGCNRMATKDEMPAAMALSLLAREAMSGEHTPSQAGPALEAWRASLSPSAKNALAEMAVTQSDQKAFARAITHLLGACQLTELPEEIEQQAPSDDLSEDEQPSEDEAAVPQEDQQTPAGDDPDEEDGYQPESGESGITGETETSSDALDSPETGSEEAAGPSDQSGEGTAIGGGSTYKAYTTRFDEEVGAADLCDPDELDRLRQQLDQQLVQLQGLVSRLAHRLQRRLMAQQQRRWEFEQEEGIIDAGRLSRVVTNPTMPLSYKYE